MHKIKSQKPAPPNQKNERKIPLQNVIRDLKLNSQRLIILTPRGNKLVHDILQFKSPYKTVGF